MPRFAIVRIEDEVVENIVEWDGDTSKWSPPPHCYARESSDADIGDVWDGGSSVFVTPSRPPIVDPFEADIARLMSFMPSSGSLTAQRVTDYIADATKPPELRATLATLRSLIRVVRGLT